MTATAVRTTTSADVRRSSRWFAAAILPVGPIAVAVLRLVLPYDTPDDGATLAAKVLAEPGRMSLVLWLTLVGALTLVPAALFVGKLARRGAPRLTAAALLLLVPGYLVLPWLGTGDGLLWAGAKAGLDVEALTRLNDAIHPSTLLSIGIYVFGHVVGTVLLGLALWRAQVVGRWAAVLVVASQPLHFVAAMVLQNHVMDFASWGMQAVGFVAVAVAILRLPDEEWDLPPR